MTYASAAARVIQEKCQSCHRPGQVAPFSLLTYDDAHKDGKIAGAGADAVVSTMAKSFNMDTTLVREMYSQAVDVTGAVNAAGIKKDLDFFMQQGWVTGKVGPQDVIDMTFAQQASAQLGPYQRKAQ